MNPLFVGIDVSSKNNVAYLMKPDGSKHSSFSVQNNLGGAKLLSERIVSALGSMQLERVVIGLEATSIYGDSLVYALREDGRLGRFQRKIHVLNPKQVRKFKEAYSDLPKNDWVDAFVIADHLRFGRINREVYMDDYRYKALQTLTRARFDVIQNLTREKQRFANYLFLKCSGMAQDKDIQNTSATTIALMEHFETVDDLANADLEELTAFITETGRGKFADPDATAKAVRAAAKGSYRLPKTVNDTVNQAMAVSIASMRALKGQVKVLDKAIEQQFEIIPNTLTSIPGIGKVYSAGIIAEIGDIHRFDSQASVAKYAGLVWNRSQSGDFEAEHSRMIKSGNRYLRYYLLEAANSVRRCDSEFRRYYDLKFKEVCLHSAFYSVSLKIFLHHLLDFIPLDFLLFPRTGIIGSACNRLLEQPVLVAVMDGQMRLMNCGDQKLGIEDHPSSLPNVLRADWVHVMDEWPTVNLPSGNSQITPHVPGNHNIPDLLPLRGAIKDLIHVPVKAEGLLSDSTVQTKIAVALLEGGEKDQFRVTSNTHPRPPRPARCTA